MVALLATLCAAAPAAGSPMTNDIRTITVSGDAAIQVVPDEVVITLGVETLDKELSKARKDNDERMARILAAAKANGVEDKWIATDHLSVEPRHEWQSFRNVFVGYAVRRTLVVTMRDLSRFDAMLTGALEAGANYVHDVRFNTTELRKHRDQARALAVKAAREKATAMAAELNQKLGRPHTITETSARWYSGYGWGWAGSRGPVQSQNVVQNAQGGDPALEGNMAPGMINVTASVQVVFELE